MYAVVKLGGTQYKISEGDTISPDRLPVEEGKTIDLDQVLLFVDGETVKVGQPYLKDVHITATVVRHDLGDKTIAFKFRRRKDSRWKKGHRPKLTSLSISKISLK